MPKTRNIIIFIAIAAVFVLIYIFFPRPSPEQPGLVSSASTATLPGVNGTSDTNIPNGTSLVTQDFLALLLNVKTIKLDDTIFSDPAFNSLHDSSIVLVPDAVTGRPNPFAQFGNDAAPQSVTPATTPATTPTTPVKITTPSTPSPTTPPVPVTIPINTTPAKP